MVWRKLRTNRLESGIPARHCPTLQGWHADKLRPRNGGGSDSEPDPRTAPTNGTNPRSHPLRQHSCHQLGDETGSSSNFPDCRILNSSTGDEAKNNTISNARCDILARPGKFAGGYRIQVAHHIPLRPVPGQPSVTDQAFLTLFASTFPLPQNKSWHLVRLEPEMLSNVISTLRGMRLPMQQWMANPALGTGLIGKSIAPTPASTTASSKNNSPPEDSTYSWLLLPESVRELLDERKQSRAKSFPMPYDMSPTPSFWPDIQTPDARQAPRTSTWQYLGSSSATGTPTQQQNHK